MPAYENYHWMPPGPGCAHSGLGAPAAVALPLARKHVGVALGAGPVPGPSLGGPTPPAPTARTAAPVPPRGRHLGAAIRPGLATVEALLRRQCAWRSEWPLLRIYQLNTIVILCNETCKVEAHFRHTHTHTQPAGGVGTHRLGGEDVRVARGAGPVARADVAVVATVTAQLLPVPGVTPLWPGSSGEPVCLSG